MIDKESACPFSHEQITKLLMILPKKIIQILEICVGRNGWNSGISILEDMAESMIDDFSVEDFQNVWSDSLNGAHYIRDDLGKKISQNFTLIIRDRFTAKIWSLDKYYFSKNLEKDMQLSETEVEWFIINLLSVAFADIMALAFLQKKVWNSNGKLKKLVYINMQKWAVQENFYIHNIVFSACGFSDKSSDFSEISQKIEYDIRSIGVYSRQECPFFYAKNRNAWVDQIFSKMQQINYE